MARIKVMLSSRCNDKLPKKDGGKETYSDVRKSLKEGIENFELFGKKIFEVWINEDSSSLPANQDSWDACMKEVSGCDILLVLVNGDAGWSLTDKRIGICHAELMTGINQSSGKICIVMADSTQLVQKNSRDKRFKAYVDSQSLFRETYKNSDELRKVTLSALAEMVTSLTKKGVREASKGRFHSGDALAWSRMSYAKRSDAMRRVVFESLTGNQAKLGSSKEAVAVKINNKEVHFFVEAVPDSLSLSAAAEMVGRPHLEDYAIADTFKSKEIGPVHIIACHKNVTTSQVIKIIGHSDILLVETPFGLYVADNIQKVQMILLKDCRDSTTTTHAVQRFEDWLAQSGEDKFLANRAASRTRIIKAIAREVK